MMRVGSKAFMLSVIMLSAIKLNTVVPKQRQGAFSFSATTLGITTLSLQLVYSKQIIPSIIIFIVMLSVILQCRYAEWEMNINQSSISQKFPNLNVAYAIFY